MSFTIKRNNIGFSEKLFLWMVYISLDFLESFVNPLHLHSRQIIFHKDFSKNKQVHWIGPIPVLECLRISGIPSTTFLSASHLYIWLESVPPPPSKNIYVQGPPDPYFFRDISSTARINT